MIIILCSPLLVEGFGGCSVVNGGGNVMEPWASNYLLGALRCLAGAVRPLSGVVKGSFEGSRGLFGVSRGLLGVSRGLVEVLLCLLGSLET